MKKLAIVTLTLAIIGACSEKTEYRVNVEMQKQQKGKAYLLKAENNRLVPFDSAQYKDGYQFTGEVEKPYRAFFSIKGSKQRQAFFIDNKKITLKQKPGGKGDFTVTGTKLNEIYQSYKDSAAYYEKENKRLYSEYQVARQNNNAVEKDSVRGEVEKLLDREQGFAKDFASKNLDNLAGLYIIRRKLVYRMDYESLNEMLAKVPESNQDNSYYKYLSDHLEKLSKTRVGQTAPNFTMKDTAGNEVSLKDFRGNYTMIDFWAAWCAPCRKANPHVLKIYNEFHPKGFQILGVSFDQSRESWIKAIHEDSLPWTQVSDLKGWKNKAGKLYGINSIPHTILLDPAGKIIDNRFSHKALRKKLEAIYNQ